VRAVADAFYRPAGPGRFESTEATAGPWSPEAQHAGPPSALLARAIEAEAPGRSFQLARLAVDILGPIPLAPLTLETRVVRPGRRVTLVEAVASVAERAVLIGRGWLVARPPGPRPPVLGPPVDLPPRPRGPRPNPWPGAHTAGYLSAVDWRFVDGGFAEHGPAQVWARSRLDLVAGEVTSPFCRVVTVADSGSGVSAVLDPAEWLFMNVDLTVVLHRPLSGPWVLLDAASATGRDGVGLARTLLADRRGPVGMALQTLVLSARAR
jgi:hypothetical protein